MFKPVSGETEFPKIEEATLRFWQENNTFEQSLQNRKGCPEYVFYDGPPFATGLPHYGHLLAGTIKDVIPRYQTMLGKYCRRTFGWDCHGLPVENEMEKQLAKEMDLEKFGKKEIEKYGIGNFNEACRGIVLRYTEEWKSIVTRMGRWVDFDNGYRTMDTPYMESIWWVFKQLWDQGLIYEGFRVQPYCPRCSTPLAQHEASQGYQEVSDPTVTVRFKLKNAENTYIIAWTTTPWTLPSNMALAVGPELDYVKVEDNGEFYIMAEARMSAYYKKDAMPAIVERYKGKDLAGLQYEPLFPFFLGEKAQGGYLVVGSEYKQIKEGFDFVENGAYRVVTADYVSTEDGTGIVHIAPLFGEDDNQVGKANGIPAVCPVDDECCFNELVPDYQGQFVKSADKAIIEWLKAEGKLVVKSTVKHSYPHCWRCDSALIYKAIPTWFMNIDKVKAKMLAANAQMTWIPGHIKEGRFGKWLENARDWNLSRNRYWGCPIPIWRNVETGETVCVGSVAELEELTGKKITDIHKHFVDDLEIVTANGTVLRRIPEVFDCWFESGSMPYAQNHYPFENKEFFDKHFPADFIGEGQDQTRGWFYTLTVLAAALFDKPAALNVIVNGMILAENGLKMSKRLKNYPDPMYVVERYGADALRLFLLESQVVRAEDLKFSEDGIKEVLRSVLLPIWNSFQFFITYANLDNWTPPAGDAVAPENPANPLDKWILSALADMVDEIRSAMDAYQLQKAANRFEAFADSLTNWYIRRSRRRFWKSQNDTDKADAYATLYYVLITFVKTAAPFIPCLTEEIYRSLRTESMPESVHLCDFPVAETWRRDEYLEKQMDLTMRTVSLGRFLRTQRSLKVRQPLARAIVVSLDGEVRKMLEENASIVAEELNVKKLDVLADEEELVHLSAKANFKALGSRLGGKMKEAAALIQKLESSAIASVLRGEEVSVTLADGTVVPLTAGDLSVIRQEKPGVCVATDNAITIALETELTDELIREGYAREIVSKIQNLRKETGLDVSDRISITLTSADPALIAAAQEYSSVICGETLGDELNTVAAEAAETDVNGVACAVAIAKK